MLLSYIFPPLGRSRWPGVWFLTLSLLGLSAVAEPAPLTLNEALARTLESHPELAQFPYRRRAAEARELQAGLRPNPEVALEVENIGGSGRFSGTDSAETSLVLSQVLELGGKRSQREQVARHRTDLLEREYQTARWQVLAETVRRFLQAAEAQERIRLAELSLTLARQSRDSIQKRVRAGITNDASLQRATIALTRAELAVAGARQQLASARVWLAAQWGDSEPSFERVSANLYPLVAMPDFAEVRNHLASSPELQRFLTEKRLREAEMQLASARGRQDLRVGVGVKHFRDTDDHAFTLSLSMPIGASDRNQGTIAARRAEYERLALEEKAARVELMARVQRLYQELTVFRQTAEQLRLKALPAARDAYESISRGYERGLYTYLELAEARRERLAVERDILAAAVNFHQTLVTLEQLTGTGLTGQWTLEPDAVKQTNGSPGISDDYEQTGES